MKRIPLRWCCLAVGFAAAVAGSMGCAGSVADDASNGKDTVPSGTGGTSSLACGTPESSDIEFYSSDAGSSDSGCILHVATTGNDSNSGSNWAEAFETVQKALDAASTLTSQEVCLTVEVWVAAGTYRPSYLEDSTDARTATFQLVPNVALYGGFAARESSRAERNSAANVTVLSGDIGAPADTSDNSFHVVTGVTGATLDGFTITGGNATGSTYVPGRCGGMYNYDSCYPAKLGGGLYNYKGSAPTVSHCTFTGNSATGGGGGIYNYQSSPVVTHCTFSDNSADEGGGMFNIGSSPKVMNCTFTDNSADDGGGMGSIGSSPKVVNCTFTDNSARLGGAMAMYDSSPDVVNCTFMGNAAAELGGGVYSNTEYSAAVITNCTFTGNSAGDSGGGIWNDGKSAIEVTNSILWGDRAGANVSEIVNRDAYESRAEVSYCIVEGGYLVTEVITDDPLFVDATNGNLQLKENSPAIDAGNGCASNVTLTDQAGNSRVDIASVKDAVNGLDIGAFEHQGVAGTYSCISNFTCS